MKHIYEFAEFQLDVLERVLIHNGEIIQLSPKVFETLLVLVQNAGHLMDKDDLMKRIWPDTFVEESNLSQNIWVLRGKLGDRNDSQFIETIPKRGYRFKAEVKEILEPDTITTPVLVNSDNSRVSVETQVTQIVIEKETEVAISTNDPGQALSHTTTDVVPWQPRLIPVSLALALADPKTRRNVGLAAITLVTLSIGYGIWWGIRDHRKNWEEFRDAKIDTIKREKSKGGALLSDGRFSPGGKMIAYSSSGSNKIIVKQIDGGEIPITKED
ncbi:MAG TPA: transcriptional regulator [Blastocatellia bacterium]|nr:transcriptional regulator [Blastocatellia bacterium]